MEKINDTHSSVILSKTKEGYEKVIFNMSIKSLFTYVCCFIFSSATMFSSMAPFGIAFYGAVFTKNSWVTAFAVSCFSFILKNKSSMWVNVAIFSLVTAVLGFFDPEGQKIKKSLLVCVSFLFLKIVFLFSSQFIIYDILALILESAVVFALVYVFETGFPVITSLKKRTFISTNESICTMAFLALGAMALSDYPKLWGFNLSGTLAVFMIYVFSLSGVNGGAVILSVLMGTIGSLKTESFALVTGTYAFGALLASSLSRHGKTAVVLGFVIANTFASLILTDASVIAVNIYDSLGAAVLFFILPMKYCRYFGGVFLKNHGSAIPVMYANEKANRQIASRLEEMSKCFEDLSLIYNGSMLNRELGKDYIFSKFDEVKRSACVGCHKNRECFGTPKSKGYGCMFKMLETALKNGKITPYTMPTEFTANCKRCDSFAEKFNSAFNVIKTERLWLSKLNDSRRFISCLLSAVGGTLSAEAERSTKTPDLHMAENLTAELDKAHIISDVVAQVDEYGDFLIEVCIKQAEITDETYARIRNAVKSVIGRDVSCSYPKYHGESNIITFFPASNYKVTAGFSLKPKNGEKISGDSFTFVTPDGKNYFAILSDGMGSGKSANAESFAAVNLMEKFIKIGFDGDTAIKLINASLLLKSARDSFTTLDICKVNLEEGTVSFTKLGAACSYIKKDGEISTVKACSLPAGILRDVDVESHYISFESDTLVVLMSDGIADIELKNSKYEGWIKNELTNIKTSNPQIIASKLCHKAQLIGENNVSDDMTVIVLNIKKV